MRRTYDKRIQTGRSKRIICKFPSVKLGRTVRVTSLLAHDLLYLLEFDQQVMTYTENAPRIVYSCDGRRCEYVFDFLIERQDIRQLAKLVPAGGFMQFPSKLRAACEEEGYELASLPAAVIRAQPMLDNIKLLTRYARLKIAPHHQRACRTLFTRTPHATLGDLMEFFDREGLGRQSVLALLYHSMLIFDLTTPLSLQSALGLPASAIAREAE